MTRCSLCGPLKTAGKCVCVQGEELMIHLSPFPTAQHGSRQRGEAGTDPSPCTALIKTRFEPLLAQMLTSRPTHQPKKTTPGN